MSKKEKSGRTALPGSPVKAIPWTAVTLVLLGLAVIAGIRMERNTTISEVRFAGNQFTGTEELEQKLGSPVGLHPDSVRFMPLIDSLLTLPWVEKAGVRVEAGGRMVVDIGERTPLALLVRGSERAFVDRNGVKMPVRTSRPVNVPLLHGFAVSPLAEDLDGNEFEAVRDFLSAARKSDLGWLTISEVAWSPDEGVVALTSENGVKLLFGTGDFSEKIDWWQAFYREVVREKGIRNFTSVDLRFRNQIVTRQG